MKEILAVFMFILIFLGFINILFLRIEVKCLHERIDILHKRIIESNT